MRFDAASPAFVAAVWELAHATARTPAEILVERACVHMAEAWPGLTNPRQQGSLAAAEDRDGRRGAACAPSEYPSSIAELVASWKGPPSCVEDPRNRLNRSPQAVAGPSFFQAPAGAGATPLPAAGTPACAAVPPTAHGLDSATASVVSTADDDSELLQTPLSCSAPLLPPSSKKRQLLFGDSGAAASCLSSGRDETEERPAKARRGTEVEEGYSAALSQSACSSGGRTASSSGSLRIHPATPARGGGDVTSSPDRPTESSVTLVSGADGGKAVLGHRAAALCGLLSSPSKRAHSTTLHQPFAHGACSLPRALHGPSC